MGYSVFVYGYYYVNEELDDETYLAIKKLEKKGNSFEYKVKENKFQSRGMEKCHSYIPDLFKIIKILKKNGYELNGRMVYIGEEFPDFGILKIEHNKIYKTRALKGDYDYDKNKFSLKMKKIERIDLLRNVKYLLEMTEPSYGFMYSLFKYFKIENEDEPSDDNIKYILIAIS